MSIPRKHEQRGVPIHPGEFLREDFLVPLGLSANALALALRVPVTRISEIVHERRGITADTALRLARYFGTTPDFWMNMQARYDLAIAKEVLSRSIHVEIWPAPRDRENRRTEATSKRLNSFRDRDATTDAEQRLLRHSRREEEGHSGGDPQGLPQACAQISPGCESGRQEGRGEVQRALRSQRHSERREEAQDLRPVRLLLRPD